MGRLVVYKPASYAGAHNNSRLTLLMLLDLIRQHDSLWDKKAKYYSVRELAAFGVEKLTYDYIRVRSPKLARWGFMSARALQRDKGRPVMGYRLEQHGKDSIERAPESAYLAAITRIYSAVPSLDPGRAAQATAVRRPKPKVESRPWTAEDIASAVAWAQGIGIWARRQPFGEDDWFFWRTEDAPAELNVMSLHEVSEFIALYKGTSS